MTSESLNIKLHLDMGDITAGVKKVKTQLSSMANTVKQSIPKINTESKKAKDSLGKVGDTSDKVKKSLGSIGNEAKRSLSDVITQSKRVTSALNSMNIATKNNQSASLTGDLTDGANSATASLEEMQGTMQSILNLQFVDLFTGLFKTEAFETAIGKVKEFGQTLRFTRTEIKDLNESWNIYWDTLRGLPEEVGLSPKELEELKAKADELSEDYKGIMKEADRLIIKKNEAIKGLKTSLKALGAELGKIALKITAITVALTAVLSAVIAIKTSKLGKELYTNAQQAGFSAQGYQEWAYVLEKAGVEAEELREIMKTLTESQVDVIDGNEDMIKAYAQLGMSVEEVKSMNQEELWNATIKALQNIENTTLRTSIAYKLFSEDTAKLTTVLNLSNEQTQQLISTYNELGGAMSKELIHNSNVLQGSLLNLKTAWQGLVNTLAQYVIPIVIVVVEWLTKAIVAVNTFLKGFFNLDMTPMTEDMSSGMDKASSAIGGVADSADTATKAVEKLRRVTMGFDELNIVGNPNADKDSSSSTGSGAGLGLADLGKVNTGNSIFLEASKQAEDLKKKIEDFINKFKGQIKAIMALLGGLTVAKLIEGLGKALGLGDKFLNTMKTIKNLAKGAITIVLQYTLVHEFMENFMDGEGIKNYIMGLITSAIGTGILYKYWGPTGLMIGLAVTAAASIKAVIDNGGITNAESATVAFTGLASAIGAIAIAVKKVDWKPFISAFGKIKIALAPVIKAVGTFVAGLSTGAVLGIAAIIAGIASAAYFLYENWDKVVKATNAWIDTNIKPILDDIKESWDNLTSSVKETAKAIAEAIPESVKEKIRELRDWVVKVWDAFQEWGGIGAIIETLGAIVVTSIGSQIAGAIKAVLNVIKGAVKYVSGIVQIISGVIELIVALCQWDLQAVGEAVQKICDGAVDAFKGLYDMTIGVIVEMVKGVVDWFWQMYDNVLEDVMPKFVKDIVSKVRGVWNDIKTWFGSNVAPKFTVSYWQNKFDTIRRAASEKMNAAKDAITGVWSSISGWFNNSVAPKFTISYWSNKFNVIKDGARSAFNGLISIVERAINGIINKINTLSWHIPDWVPVFGGSTFGFNMRQVSIPRLATGGIAVGDTLAHIGEGGYREAVLPLDRNTGWMDELADKIAARNSAPTKVALIVDGKELGWATINNINAITKQTGGLQLAL